MAWIGIAAIVAAIVLILWARIEVHGTHDIEAALAGDPAAQQGASGQRGDAPVPHEVDSAVTRSRWATGFSP